MITLLILENTRAFGNVEKQWSAKSSKKGNAFSLLFLKGCLLSLEIIILGFYWPEPRADLVQNAEIVPTKVISASLLMWQLVPEFLNTEVKIQKDHPNPQCFRQSFVWSTQKQARAIPCGFVRRKLWSGSPGDGVNSVTWNDIVMTGDAEHSSNTRPSESTHASFFM